MSYFCRNSGVLEGSQFHDYAYLDITPETAKAILAQHEVAQKLLSEFRAGIFGEITASALQHEDGGITVYAVFFDLWDEAPEHLCTLGEGWHKVEELTIPEEAIGRVECRKIHYDGQIRLSALDKYSESNPTTPDLRGILKEIASHVE